MSDASDSSLPTPVARPPAYFDDRHDRHLTQANQHIGQRRQTGLARRHTRRCFQRRHKIVVRQEEAIDGTIEHHDLQIRIIFYLRDHAVQLRYRFRSKDIEWRMVDRDAPIGWRHTRDPELLLRIGRLLRALSIGRIGRCVLRENTVIEKQRARDECHRHSCQLHDGSPSLGYTSQKIDVALATTVRFKTSSRHESRRAPRG
jgi:hypothetical protein